MKWGGGMGGERRVGGLTNTIVCRGWMGGEIQNKMANKTTKTPFQPSQGGGKWMAYSKYNHNFIKLERVFSNYYALTSLKYLLNSPSQCLHNEVSYSCSFSLRKMEASTKAGTETMVGYFSWLACSFNKNRGKLLKEKKKKMEGICISYIAYCVWYLGY